MLSCLSRASATSSNAKRSCLVEFAIHAYYTTIYPSCKQIGVTTKCLPVLFPTAPNFLFSIQLTHVELQVILCCPQVQVLELTLGLAHRPASFLSRLGELNLTFTFICCHTAIASDAKYAQCYTANALDAKYAQCEDITVVDAERASRLIEMNKHTALDSIKDAWSAAHHCTCVSLLRKLS